MQLTPEHSTRYTEHDRNVSNTSNHNIMDDVWMIGTLCKMSKEAKKCQLYWNHQTVCNPPKTKQGIAVMIENQSMITKL